MDFQLWLHQKTRDRSVCLSFVSNANRMEVIKSMRNLFSSKYKEDDNKYKKKIFVGLVFTCVINAYRKRCSKNIFWPIRVLQFSVLGFLPLSLCIYDIDPLFWNAKFHLCGDDEIIYRSNKYLHGLLYNLLCDFDKLQDRDKLGNVVLNSNIETLGVWCTPQSEISWFCLACFLFDESLSFCCIFKTTWDTVRLAIKSSLCTEDRVSRMCL